MDVSGTQRIEAPPAAVYRALNDPAVLRQCIPGCQSVERISDEIMKASVRLKIGPMAMTFGGTVTLSDRDPPRAYTITGQGSGGVAGHAKGSAKVSLAPDGDATSLSYVVTADIGGKIAQLGARLLDGAARTLAADFFARLNLAVTEQPPQPAAAAEG